MTISKRIQEKFIEFLNSERAYDTYLEAIKTTHYNDIAYLFKTFGSPPEFLISNVFSWNDTLPSEAYWRQLDEAWKLYLKTPRPLKVFKI